MVKKQDSYPYGMREAAFERIMQIVHGEYEFDPAVSSDHRAWWFENALYCLKGFAFYQIMDNEMVYL